MTLIDSSTNDQIILLRDRARQIQEEVDAACRRLELDLQESDHQLVELRQELVLIWPAFLLAPTLVISSEPNGSIRRQMQHLTTRLRGWIRPQKPVRASLWHGPARLLVGDYQSNSFGHVTTLMHRVILDAGRASADWRITYSRIAKQLENRLKRTLKEYHRPGGKAKQVASFLKQARMASAWLLERPLTDLAKDSDFTSEKRKAIVQALQCYNKSFGVLRRLGNWVSPAFMIRCQMEQYKCEFYLRIEPVNVSSLVTILGVIQRIASLPPFPSEAQQLAEEMRLTIARFSIPK